MTRAAVLLRIIGRTTDGRAVYAGVYQFFETHGIPLDVLLGILRDHGAIPCWRSFYREALSAGMKHDRILARLDEALSDVYGPSFRDHVVRILENDPR